MHTRLQISMCSGYILWSHFQQSPLQFPKFSNLYCCNFMALTQSYTVWLQEEHQLQQRIDFHRRLGRVWELRKLSHYGPRQSMSFTSMTAYSTCAGRLLNKTKDQASKTHKCRWRSVPLNAHSVRVVCCFTKILCGLHLWV